ncbi:MAG: type II toxin-antitoxin system prevent-host-death family antitoxin [Bryobacteraceae bacterium]
MTNVVSSLTARTQFGQIMRRAAARKERFPVDRNGEPAVIIISVEDYMDTFSPEPTWLAEIRAKSKERGRDKLSMTQINSIVSEVRRSAKKTVNATAK